MPERPPAHPRRLARACGALYLYVIAAGSFAQAVRGSLVVPGDAAATAANVLAREGLLRLAFTGELLHLCSDVAIAGLLFALTAPVDRTLALLAALFRVACDVVLAVGSLLHFAALRLLQGGSYLPAVPADERADLALLALRLHADAYAVCLLFFAFACLALGVLLHRSGFVPRALGVALGVAGGCYLVMTLGHLLAPAVGARLLAPLVVPVFLAELSLALWLVVRGVDPGRWAALAARHP